jgi:hypothetical protein
MRTGCLALLALSIAAVSGASAAELPASPPVVIAGHTLNAVVYVMPPPGSRGSHIDRLMLQAYLGPGGRALVRVWDGARDAYTPAAERNWNLKGSLLCIGLTGNAPPSICADVHVWGPRIAGAAARPYVQLNGDLQPGNTIAGRP